MLTQTQTATVTQIAESYPAAGTARERWAWAWRRVRCGRHTVVDPKSGALLYAALRADRPVTCGWYWLGRVLRFRYPRTSGSHRCPSDAALAWRDYWRRREMRPR